MQVVSEGCREAYVQRRTVRVCTGGRGRLGLDDLLLLRGLRGGLALLPLPEAVLDPEAFEDPAVVTSATLARDARERYEALGVEF